MASTSPPKITPFIWYDANAEEAVALYTSLFKDSRILGTTRYGEGAPMPKGTVMTIDFELFGQRFMALNGGPHFKLNEAVSFMVSCETQAEINLYWEKLIAGGGKAMECGWLKDRFGLSWQIVPAILPELMNGPNSGKVMQALWGKVKLDIAGLKRAGEGG